MPETITIDIGVGTTIDGGPFVNAKVTDVTDDGMVVVTDRTGYEDALSLDYIEDALTDEMENDEPISITGVSKEDSVGSIELPLANGFDVTIYGNPSVEIIPLEAIREGGVAGYDYDVIQGWIATYGAEIAPA